MATSRLREAYALVKQAHRDKRERPNEVRQAAWYMHTAHTPLSQSFWRWGFLSRFGKRLETYDYTCIRGYDTIHQQIAGMFPEYDAPDGEWRLWSFLLSPYDRMPSRGEMLAEAQALIDAGHFSIRRRAGREVHYASDAF
jgi:hypothetical protein